MNFLTLDAAQQVPPKTVRFHNSKLNCTRAALAFGPSEIEWSLFVRARQTTHSSQLACWQRPLSIKRIKSSTDEYNSFYYL